MKPLIIPFPGNEDIAHTIVGHLDAEMGSLEHRRFPDRESYIRIDTPVENRDVILVCTLDRPDEKLPPLIFSADAARSLGAAQVGLVAPYLAYMRQDQRFQPGEAVTSNTFARMLSPWIDWLITIDPHLHRRTSLSEIYALPSVTLHAAAIIADYIRKRIKNPVLIGPDSESEQWIAAIAKEAEAPSIILEKTRLGDRQVKVSVPNIEQWKDHTPILVDDIISTARTMIETIGHLSGHMAPPICIGVHAIFADQAYQDLQSAGPECIITCNTITHESNVIDISALIADGIPRMRR